MAKKHQNESTTHSRDLIGLLPPQAVELEEAVLGASLLERDGCTALLAQISNSDVFYKDRHKLIFQAIVDLRTVGDPVDLLTVSNRLKEKGELEDVGGAIVIMDLTNKVNSAANILKHIRIITEKWIKRELIKSASDILSSSFDPTTDVFEIVEKAQTHLINVQGQLSRKEARTVSEIMPDVWTEWERAHHAENGVVGIPTGISTLDKNTGGLKKGEVTVIGARPGMGKTAFIIQIIHNVIKYKKGKVALFSMEMRDTEIVGRLIVRETEIQKKRLTNGDFSISEIKEKAKGVMTNSVLIDDSPALTVLSLRSKASALKLKHKIDLIIIDYLQLAKGSGKGGFREQEISEISRGMKELAKELDVPVVELSQLSREVEKRPDKRPMQSDLRESGSIEQDADNIWFLYRPEYYDIFEDENGNDTRGTCEVIISKQRDGVTGKIDTLCNIGLNKFWTYENVQEPKDFTEPNSTDWAAAFDQKSGDVF